MKKTTILLILLLSLSFKLFAQQHVVDSFLNITNNKLIPFEERYELASHIYVLSYQEQIPILLSLVPEAKLLDEKHHLILLYAFLVNFYISSDVEKAELYVDSLCLTEANDLTLSPSNSGRIHYTAGSFYTAQGQTAKGCEHLYIAANHYSKYEEGKKVLLYVYHDLANIYINSNEDINGVERLLNILKEKKYAHGNLSAQLLVNNVFASYFILKYEKDQTQLALIDSALFYHLLAVKAYDNCEKPILEQTNEVVDIYLSIADCYKYLGKTNLALEYLEKFKKGIDTNNPDLMSYYYMMLGRINLQEHKYNEAQINLKKGLVDFQTAIGDISAIAYYSPQIYCYTDLSLACEAIGDYKSALKYEKKGRQLDERKSDLQIIDLIQRYQTEYEVEGKKREIATLTTLNESEKQIKNLYLGIFILSVVILLLSTWWFVTKRRIAASELQIVKLKKDEAELQSQLETERASVLSFKIEEQDREYKELVQAKELEQYTAYIDGLEVERTRLAKELHDNVANEILAIGMSLHAQADKQQIDTMLNKLGAQVRNISHELIPPVFNLVNLFDNLTDYVAKLNNANNNLIVLNASPNIDWEQLPANYASELYRITQEACSNSLKYAEASQIKIDLEYNYQVISLTISDNGNGFDTSKPVKGIGLRTMQIRANSIGALFSVKSQNGEGTQVQLTCDIRHT